MAPRRDWRDPFTHQIYHDVPIRLAKRLDELVTAAHWRSDEPHSADRSAATAKIRDQVQYLLDAFGQRDAYRRTLDEIHAGDDGLLPISDDRRGELQRLADTFAGMRDLYLAWAVADGATVEDAALAAGITVSDALKVIIREQKKPDEHE